MKDLHSFIMAQKAIWVKRLLHLKDAHFLTYLEDVLPEISGAALVVMLAGFRIKAAYHGRRERKTNVHIIIYV